MFTNNDIGYITVSSPDELKLLTQEEANLINGGLAPAVLGVVVIGGTVVGAMALAAGIAAVVSYVETGSATTVFRKLFN